jgi:hypothetical protein
LGRRSNSHRATAKPLLKGAILIKSSPPALAQVGSRPEAFIENFQRPVLRPAPAGAKTGAKTNPVGGRIAQEDPG